MIKLNDSNLSNDQYLNVCHHAQLLLSESAAHGVFPTPVDNILSAAKLTVIDDSSIDEGLLQHFFKKAKAELSALKSALSKVLGLFDAQDRLVVLDKDLPKPRIPFIKLHETGHGYLPHQSSLYKLIHDCDKTLDPEVTDLFEREANVFASEVMFQGKHFELEAHDHDFSINVPMKLAKKYGASMYSAFRRYVTTSNRNCCLLVLEQVIPKLDGGYKADIRRVVSSSGFMVIYGANPFPAAITNKDTLSLGIPHLPKKMKYPIDVYLKDANGELRRCSIESFNNTHQILMLVCDLGAMNSFILPDILF